MPWLDEDLEGWEELSDDERERVRAVIEDLGLEFGVEDEADYFE